MLPHWEALLAPLPDSVQTQAKEHYALVNHFCQSYHCLLLAIESGPQWDKTPGDEPHYYFSDGWSQGYTVANIQKSLIDGGHLEKILQES